MLVLPQILLGLVLVVGSVTSPLVWRNAVGGAWGAIRTKPIRSVVWAAAAAGGVWLLAWALAPVEVPQTGTDTSVAIESWPTFHGGPSRCGTTGSPDPPPSRPSDLRVRWKFHDSLALERRPFACSPAIADSRVVIGGDNFTLYCVDLYTGQPQWTFAARWPIFSSPAIWRGRLYIGEGLHEQTDSKFYCLDLANGKVLWSIQTNSHTESSPAVAGGRVYFGAGDDGVYCADALTGQVRWHYPDAHVDSGLLVLEDRVYFGSGYRFKGVVCVSTQDGHLAWKRSFRAPVWGAPSFADGRLYVAVGNGNFNESATEPYGEVRCLDPANGEDLWRFTDVRDGVLTSVAVYGDHAVFGCRDGVCYALNATTGALVWRTDVEAPILSSPAIAGGRVFFGADDGLFRAIDLDTGQEVWSLDTTDDMLIIMEDPRVQSSPAVAAGNVVFGAANGNVYCLDSEIGQVAASAPVVAETGYRSRLMRAADSLMAGLIARFAQLTGSYGIAIILAALVVKAVLLPLDWRQTLQSRRLKQLRPDVERLRREYVDYRVHRYEVRQLYAARGIGAWGAMLSVLLQVPLFIVVFLVLQATSVFAGQSFMWISDLAAPDRFELFLLFGPRWCVLPVVLAASVWLYSAALAAGQRKGLVRWALWLLVSVGMGFLTYRWSAALLLFATALLWIGLLEYGILSILPIPAAEDE